MRGLVEFLATYKAQGCQFELHLPQPGGAGFQVYGEALAADGERVAALSIFLPKNAPRLYAKQVAALAAASHATTRAAHIATQQTT